MNNLSEYLDYKYKSINIISDPIYNSIKFTAPSSSIDIETTERDLIDNKWLQRLRKIHQLQSTFWVFPSAENSRFIHSLGTMHLAGEFGKHLYNDLKINFSDSCPSINFIEEFLRICGLLHDIGHGPFGHKFDSSFLEIKFNGLNHEKISSKIIEEKLRKLIIAIKRSPSGLFNEGEVINPIHISYIINKSAKYKNDFPKWLRALKALFCGQFFTIDNLDYVLRDSYFTGYSKDPLKVDRILFYTSINKEGLIFSSQGKNTFKQFINLKTDLYNSIYFHRTVRAIDLAIDSVFYKTMEKICDFNPINNLDKYLKVTEWDLFNICSNWINSDNQDEKELGIKWCKILNREKTWFVAFDKEIKIGYSQNNESLFFSQFINIKEVENKIYSALKEKFNEKNIENVAISIDTPSLDPRPLEVSLEEKMKIFNNNIDIIEEKRIFEWISDIPVRIINFRVYTNNKDYIKDIAEISESLLSKYMPSYSTNI